ncbi:MAG: replication-associated recombination protein A [Alphaproteobacteria bacterium]
MDDLFQSHDDTFHMQRPLADRLRPQDLEDIVGQDHLVGAGGSFRKMAKSGRIGSMILWGPPGTGKTTLARILSQHSDLHFVQISAIFSGVKDLRAVFDGARMRRSQGKGTLLFVDEIHRFMRSQQDAFLPVVEDGTITLIGATTENPSFELNSALLSRCQVFVLKRLNEDALEIMIKRAEKDLGRALPLNEEARGMLKTMADGDGRYALMMVEHVFAQSCEGDTLDAEAFMQLVQKRAPSYDKAADGHYNLLSAFHKSIRGSDPDAALYWMCRMLEGGEDPRTITRRMTCIAAEDISLADPNAMQVAVAAWQAYERLGLPEGELALAQAVVYLATAPKSNATYLALKAAKSAAKNSGTLMPPKHILNAPTGMMQDQGYGAGYQYDHDMPDAFSGQDYFPDELGRQIFYRPNARGFERDIQKRLDYWNKLRAQKRSKR